MAGETYIKISELQEAILPLDGTEDIEIVSGAVSRRCSTQDIADLAAPYKLYQAIISQSGTNNPSQAITYINQFETAIVFTRTDIGTYTAPLAGVNTNNTPPVKSVAWNASTGKTWNIGTSGTGTLVLVTLDSGTPADGVLNSEVIEFKSYI